jgi:hypothetical protein
VSGSPGKGGGGPLVGGERFIPLAVVADCYEVELTWVQEVYEFGLLGEGRRVEGKLAVSTVMLERVAVIRRLTLQQGLNLAGVAALLEVLGE